MKAIIAGTGFDHMEGLSLTRRVVENRWGSVELFLGTQDDEGLLFLPRHGSDHFRAPHMIDYRANIQALTDLGVTEAVAIYAVGSISDRLKPGEVGIVGDWVDFTGMGQTFYDEGEVVHISVDEPFSRDLQQRAKARMPSLQESVVYVTTKGPRLETKAEIAFFARQGFDVVGMTLASEATLLAERSIATLALAYSINWAAGVGEGRVTFIDDDQIEAMKVTITQLCRSILSI
ncbi:MAG: MTAP family purine nucleoside phosphorylase [Sphaerochaeta sp.]|jgi:purine nucleoside phosphorylase|nr:MTAP family purine nucleoside phosphorylase [Sphaerochaeta sp.]MDX9915270.1 MTAP family purine nucleoside phosphorylase [Sphaerochaeta sp.]